MITELGHASGEKHLEFYSNTFKGKRQPKVIERLRNRTVFKFRGTAFGTSLFYVLRSNQTGYLCNNHHEVHNH